MTYSEEDRLALLASVDHRLSGIRIPKADIISVSEAKAIAGVSDETIRRWCVKYGIGRKYRAYSWADNVWQVSRPGLLIVMHRDWDALEQLLADQRHHPALTPYLGAD